MLLACFIALLSVASARATDEGDHPGPYALDAVPRVLPVATRRVRCDRTRLVRYRGTSVRFSANAEIDRDFVPYVARFERIVREVAIAKLGRAPRVLAHHGAFNCRTIRGSREVLSEHALGNAIDVRGFDFGRARADEPLPPGVPARLARSFRVRVEKHWRAGADGRYAAEADFLAALCARLEREPNLFRVMLGPAFPGHDNHLHFDRAPFTYVAL
jgi:hypothetical protein